jgi:polysaccharide export outer membrane protein
MRNLLSRARLALFLAAVSALLWGCMTDVTPTTQSPQATDTVTDTVVSQQAQPAVALASADPLATDYLISSRDVVDIAVFQVQDLNKTVQVSEDGNVTLPLVGKIRVAGKTTHQAEEIIADKLRQRYMQSPQVTISVKQYGQKITVSGEVKTPRVIALEGKVTLSQAVAGAGGLSDLANSKRVHIARSNGQHIRDEVYDYDAIQAGRLVDPLLQGGDLVVAEQSGTQVALKNVKDMLPFAILATVL